MNEWMDSGVKNNISILIETQTKGNKVRGQGKIGARAGIFLIHPVLYS